jgi:hypothetical protein
MDINEILEKEGLNEGRANINNIMIEKNRAEMESIIADTIRLGKRFGGKHTRGFENILKEFNKYLDNIQKDVEKKEQEFHK